MTHSKGISWIDDVRIPFVDENTSRKITENKNNINVLNSKKVGSFDDTWKQGRFPANILVSDDMLNDGIITKVQENLKEQNKQYKGGNFGGGSVKNNFYFGDSGSSSRYYDIDKWFNNLIDV
jgi:hypothetical protein